MLIDGREIAKKLKLEVADEVSKLKAKGIHPCLCVCLVGDDPASKIYVKNKQKSCEEVGILSKVEFPSSSVSASSIFDLIRQWNEDKKCHGVLVQLPLPEHIDRLDVINAVSSSKDVDGFHHQNIGLLVQGKPNFIPCTPLAIKYLLDYHNIKVSGKNVVIINDTIVVGKPLAMLLNMAGATVTLCNSKTENLVEISKSADILVSAVGKRPDFIVAGNMIRKGAAVFDVGVNRIDGKICGDVDFDDVIDRASYLTKMPGCIGLITIAMLLKNTLKAAKGE
jgi:methylenetetrahydrofolate dehydrogenase (NADP+)/methenyltetrahydrofolate cyclohydrolase